jgi:hypothetical protein
MTKQDMNAVIIAINEFAQGSPLPYTVLDATHINAAYPEQKLEIRGGTSNQCQSVLCPYRSWS